MKHQGRSIYQGHAEGEALVTNMGISFFGGVDPDTGIVVERGHELEGQTVSGKVLVFPTGKGSTVGSYTLYRLRRNGVAPLGNCERSMRDDHRRRLHHRRDPVCRSHPVGATAHGRMDRGRCQRGDR